jgi:hypothetical protein
MEVIIVPRKRNTETKSKRKASPKITVKSASIPKVDATMTRLIVCIWDSRLIVGGDKTPSGMRYEFETGEEKPVLEEDYYHLLAMETRPYGCCGGTIKPQKYFDEV